jgi:hypothetical protein
MLEETAPGGTEKISARLYAQFRGLDKNTADTERASLKTAQTTTGLFALHLGQARPAGTMLSAEAVAQAAAQDKVSATFAYVTNEAAEDNAPQVRQMEALALDSLSFSTGISQATGAPDGRLAWFLVTQAWKIWHDTQTQLQSDAGSVTDVLSGVKSAISGQASNNTTTGNGAGQKNSSPKQVAQAANQASAQEGHLALTSAMVKLDSAAPGTRLSQFKALRLSTAAANPSGAPDPTDVANGADALYQNLQNAAANCPASSGTTTPPPATKPPSS